MAGPKGYKQVKGKGVKREDKDYTVNEYGQGTHTGLAEAAQKQQSSANKVEKDPARMNMEELMRWKAKKKQEERERRRREQAEENKNPVNPYTPNENYRMKKD